MSSTSGPTLVATASDRIVSSIHSALASLNPTPRNSNTPRQIGTPPLPTLSSLSHNKVIGVDSGRILPAGYGNGYGAGYTTSRKDGLEQQQQSSSSGSSISHNDNHSNVWPQGQDLEEDDLLDIHTRLQDRQQRNQIAKEAAKILLAQFMQDDDEYEVFPRLSPSLSRTTRLGLAPMTLLLNPETPCPTKIIPLPTSSSNSNNNVASYASSSSSEDSNNNAFETQSPSRFMRLL